MPLDLPIATQLCSGGNKEANAIAGVPDLVMRRQQGYALHRITVMLEIKNPWQVTPAGIDQVIRATQNNNDNRDVPAREVASSRLALEQLYGYMVRNGKTYGVLATVKGWCFLHRENGGLLYITPMFGDFQGRQGVSYGMAYEGYYNPQGFPIMQALYYLSAVAETTDNLPETPIGSRPGQVTLPYAGDPTTPAPTIQQAT